MIEFISFLIFIIILGLSIVINVYLYVQRTNLKRDLVTETLNRYILVEKLEKEQASKDAKNIEGNDGFLNFVSQSRDWAFGYIEDAQEKIADFDTKLNEIINLSDNKKQTIKKILEAYEPVKQLLPDDQGEKTK